MYRELEHFLNLYKTRSDLALRYFEDNVEDIVGQINKLKENNTLMAQSLIAINKISEVSHE